VLGGVATIFAAGLAARTLFRTGARPVSPRVELESEEEVGVIGSPKF
jgi:hypothetical protein